MTDITDNPTAGPFLTNGLHSSLPLFADAATESEARQVPPTGTAAMSERYFDPNELSGASPCATEGAPLDLLANDGGLSAPFRDVFRELDSRKAKEGADTFAQQKGFFDGWTNKVSGLLAAAYPLGLHLLVESEADVKKFLKHEFFQSYDSNRRRRPSAKKRLLIALQYCARPSTEDERKVCSSYAPMLAWAAAKAVQPDEFATKMQNITLRHATAEMRNAKKAAKSEKPNAEELSSTEDFGSRVGEAVEVGEPSSPVAKLTITVDDGSSPTSCTLTLDPQACAVLRGVISAVDREDDAVDMLTVLCVAARDSMAAADSDGAGS